jgi:hypothetical protein
MVHIRTVEELNLNRPEGSAGRGLVKSHVAMPHPYHLHHLSVWSNY